MLRDEITGFDGTYIGIGIGIGWYIKQPMYLLFIWGGTKWF
jgi:hypothetical protein